MTDFSTIDPNFRVEPAPDADGLVYRDALDPSFSLLGVTFEKGCYRRLPAAVARSVSEEVELLHTHTAGGCLAFLTDSKRITLRVKMHNVEKMPHFALTGSGGFDLYERKEGAYRYLTTFIPPFALTDGFSSQRVLEDRRKRELRLYFPLYSGVTALSIGLEPGCVLRPVTVQEPPLVFYGSSITQGGCASHPGGCWTNILSRWHNCEFYNFGFSGSGKGEPAAAEILAGIENPRCFILDYEANAHNEGIRATLEKFLDILRSKHPQVPITVISKAPHGATMLSFGADDNCTEVSEDCRLSQEFQREVVAKRRAAGDENIYFVNGLKLLGIDWGECMMDGCHFNDLGFYRFAENLNRYIKF